MFNLKIVTVVLVLGAVLCVSSAPTQHVFENFVSVDKESAELIREKREAEPTRKHHHLHILAHRPQYVEYHRPTQEYHHNTGGNVAATFAQSSAGTISGNAGHGNTASQSSSHSASYSFGPFSASFSASQSNANAGGFFDY